MGLLGDEVATEVTLGKLRETLGKAHPTVDWSAIEAKYNSIIAAGLEADTLLDIEGILMDEVQNTEAGEMVEEEDPKEQVDSSASISLDSDDTSSTSTSDSLSSSDESLCRFCLLPFAHFVLSQVRGGF